MNMINISEKHFMNTRRIMNLLLLLVTLTASSKIFAQQESNNIKIELIEEKDGSKTLKFVNSILKIQLFERVSISPNKQVVAVMQFALDGQFNSVVNVYDINGALKKKLNVKSLDKMLITNEEKIALYGFKNEHAPKKSYLYFYDENGIEINNKEYELGWEHLGCISDSGNYLAFLADADSLLTTPKKTVLLIFNKNFSLINEYLLEDWSLHSPLWKPKIDEQNLEIKIRRYRGSFPDLKKETIYLGINDKNFKTIEGWDD